MYRDDVRTEQLPDVVTDGIRELTFTQLALVRMGLNPFDRNLIDRLDQACPDLLRMEATLKLLQYVHGSKLSGTEV